MIPRFDTYYTNFHSRFLNIMTGKNEHSNILADYEIKD